MNKAKMQWVAWLSGYTASRFYDAFVSIAQNAKSICIQCGKPIFLDIVEGGGIPDWKTEDGDYGCDYSPETTSEGAGSHRPTKLGDERAHE